MEDIFYRYACRLPAHFGTLSPLSAPDTGAFRKGLPAYIRDYVSEEAAKAAERLEDGRGWPQLLASDYMRFSRDGNRVSFEKAYFRRRAILTLLSLAEIIENKGTYPGHIADGIMLLCEESGWQLPAHNSSRRDAPQDPLPSPSRPVIDLFAAETAAELSVIYSLLKDSLDGISPIICKRIASELEARIIRPYLDCHFWWMGNGDEPMCNWTPWITENILLTAFLTPQTDAVRRETVKKALYSLDCFLKDYGEDGCCSEGVEYYRHAGLCLYNAADILSVVTGGLTEDAFALPKMRNIAEYVANMHVGGSGGNGKPFSPCFFNFADCSPRAGMSGAREFLFGRRVKSPLLCGFAARSWKESDIREKLLGLSADCEEGCNIFHLLQTLGAASELDAYGESGGQDEAGDKRGSISYPSVGVFIMNRGSYSLAVKSGGNGDSHNHNDTGSLTLYKDGKPLLIDAGVGSYTKQTFSADRYSIWTMQSSYHNLPEIDGMMQLAGADYRARDVETTDESISQDIAPCYPPETGLSSYIRRVSCPGSGVTVDDHAVFHDGKAHGIVLNLMLSEKPAVDGNVIRAGETGSIRVSRPGGEDAPAIASEEIKIDDERLGRAWKGSLYRLRIPFTDKIHIEIT